MTTAIAELDKLLNLIEAQIPANPNSPKNIRNQARLQREMARYFRSLNTAFPYSKLAKIYNRHVKESLASDSKDILDPLLAAFKNSLTFSLNGYLAEVYVEGQAEMITWGKTKGGVPIAFEGPPSSRAVDFAAKRAAQTVTQMDQESKRRLAQVISDAIKNKRGIPGLSRDIRKSFDNMAKFRSDMIARTETANALSQASLDSMKAMDITGKEWVTVGDARVSAECQGNEAEGVIPRDQDFSSGLMRPPQHPNCRCSLAPGRLRR